MDYIDDLVAWFQERKDRKRLEKKLDIMLKIAERIASLEKTPSRRFFKDDWWDRRWHLWPNQHVVLWVQIASTISFRLRLVVQDLSEENDKTTDDGRRLRQVLRNVDETPRGEREKMKLWKQV